MSQEEVIRLLKELIEAEKTEIQGSAAHIATTKNPIARLVYELAIADATRHLEIFSTILHWMEEGKPIGEMDILPKQLGNEITIESDVRDKVTGLLPQIVDPDSKALLWRVVADEEQHERILEYLRSITLEFKSPRSQAVFNYLVQRFVNDYMARRLVLEQAGWSALTDMARAVRIPLSTLYSSRENTAHP